MKRRIFTLASLVLSAQICTAIAEQFPYVTIVPERRGTCFQILELERLRVNPQTSKMLVYPGEEVLSHDYAMVVSWLQGFISATGVLSPDQVNIGQQNIQWMTWLFSYCRTNPTKNIADAALALANALKDQRR